MVKSKKIHRGGHGPKPIKVEYDASKMKGRNVSGPGSMKRPGGPGVPPPKRVLKTSWVTTPSSVVAPKLVQTTPGKLNLGAVAPQFTSFTGPKFNATTVGTVNVASKITGFTPTKPLSIELTHVKPFQMSVAPAVPVAVTTVKSAFTPQVSPKSSTSSINPSVLSLSNPSLKLGSPDVAAKFVEQIQKLEDAPPRPLGPKPTFIAALPDSNRASKPGSLESPPNNPPAVIPIAKPNQSNGPPAIIPRVPRAPKVVLEETIKTEGSLINRALNLGSQNFPADKGYFEPAAPINPDYKTTGELSKGSKKPGYLEILPQGSEYATANSMRRNPSTKASSVQAPSVPSETVPLSEGNLAVIGKTKPNPRDAGYMTAEAATGQKPEDAGPKDAGYMTAEDMTKKGPDPVYITAEAATKQKQAESEPSINAVAKKSFRDLLNENSNSKGKDFANRYIRFGSLTANELKKPHIVESVLGKEFANQFTEDMKQMEQQVTKQFKYKQGIGEGVELTNEQKTNLESEIEKSKDAQIQSHKDDIEASLKKSGISITTSQAQKLANEKSKAGIKQLDKDYEGLLTGINKQEFYKFIQPSTPSNSKKQNLTKEEKQKLLSYYLEKGDRNTRSNSRESRIGTKEKKGFLGLGKKTVINKNSVKDGMFGVVALNGSKYVRHNNISEKDRVEVANKALQIRKQALKKHGLNLKDVETIQALKKKEYISIEESALVNKYINYRKDMAATHGVREQNNAKMQARVNASIANRTKNTLKNQTNPEPRSFGDKFKSFFKRTKTAPITEVVKPEPVAATEVVKPKQTKPAAEVAEVAEVVKPVVLPRKSASVSASEAVPPRKSASATEQEPKTELQKTYYDSHKEYANKEKNFEIQKTSLLSDIEKLNKDLSNIKKQQNFNNNNLLLNPSKGKTEEVKAKENEIKQKELEIGKLKQNLDTSANNLRNKYKSVQIEKEKPLIETLKQLLKNTTNSNNSNIVKKQKRTKQFQELIKLKPELGNINVRLDQGLSKIDLAKLIKNKENTVEKLEKT